MFIFTASAFCPLAPFAYAYEFPLNSTTIHEAYILGQRNDQATADFLAPYVKELIANGQIGSHIAEIQVLTPFVQVVDESRKNTSGYTEQQAADDYRRRGNSVLVRIVLMLPAAFPKQRDSSAAARNTQNNAPLRPENFWQNFRFNVRQRGKTIASRAIRNTPIYSAATKDTPAVLDGATVWLEFDAKDISSDQFVVEVVTPDAKNITAAFDLKRLR
jgi:hypothetical protein